MPIKTKIIAFKKFITSNSEYPVFKIIFIIYFSGLFLKSIVSVWGEHHFIRGLVEEFITLILYTIVLFAWVPLLYYSCSKISEQLNKTMPYRWSKALTIIAGITIFILYIPLTSEIIDLIPGVNWRYKRVFSSNEY